MPFPLPVRMEALIACQRQCCLCHQRKHTQITCHHIIPEADGGPDTFDNCIPLCPDCHAQVESYNPRHPFASTRYHPEELKRRRDDWHTAVRRPPRALRNWPSTATALPAHRRHRHHYLSLPQ